MGAEYIPRADAKAAAWMGAFARTLAGDVARYDISDLDGQHLLSVVAAFDAARRLAEAPATRTAVTVLEKDQRRAEAQGLCRSLAMRVKSNHGISDADKVAAGVVPVNPQRVRRRVPASSPALTIAGATPAGHLLHYSVQLPGEKGGTGKPFGAVAMQIFCAVADAGERPSVDDARLAATVTRPRFTIAHRPADVGRRATYWGRWISARGEAGPWSGAIGFTIAA